MGVGAEGVVGHERVVLDPAVESSARAGGVTADEDAAHVVVVDHVVADGDAGAVAAEVLAPDGDAAVGVVDEVPGDDVTTTDAMRRRKTRDPAEIPRETSATINSPSGPMLLK